MWWRTNPNGSRVDGSDPVKFPTLLGFTPNNATGVLRFIGPNDRLLPSETPIKLFKALLLVNPPLDAAQVVDTAICRAAIRNRSDSGCTQPADHLVTTYMEGLWDYAYSQAAVPFPSSNQFSRANNRTVITVPRCFNGPPRQQFEYAVGRAKGEFRDPQFFTEDASVLRLVTGNKLVLPARPTVRRIEPSTSSRIC